MTATGAFFTKRSKSFPNMLATLLTPVECMTSHRILLAEGGAVPRRLPSPFGLLEISPIIQYVGALKGLPVYSKGR